MESRAWIGWVVIAGLAVAGCGGDDDSPAAGGSLQRGERDGDAVSLTRDDPAGDVNRVSATIRTPELARLDLESATLRRDPEELTLRITTAKPPRAPMTQTLAVFDDQLRSETRVVVTWARRGRPPSARLHRVGQASRPVPVTVAGPAVTVAVPLGDLTRRGQFKWQAWTTATGGDVEITDTLPDRYGNVAFFPDLPRKAER